MVGRHEVLNVCIDLIVQDFGARHPQHFERHASRIVVVIIQALARAVREADHRLEALRLPSVPVWSGDRITPQWLRSFGTTFSAALIAHVEATFDDDAEKNALCTPIVPPTLAADWLRMLDVSMKNHLRWSAHPGLQQWLAGSRLNSLFHAAAGIKPDEAEKIALLQRHRQAIKPAVARMSHLMATQT